MPQPSGPSATAGGSLARWPVRWSVLLLALFPLSLAAQPPEPKVDVLPAPRRVDPSKNPDGEVFLAQEAGREPQPGMLPIDLPTALRLALTNNLDIAEAQTIVAQAQAALERARVMTLPSMNAGSTFVDHTGRIQQAIGNIVLTHRESLYVGGGPSMTFSLAEAIYVPLAARQRANASQANLQRVSNDALLSVAETYFTVLRARRRLAALEETLDYLSSDRRSPARAQSKGLLPLIRDIVDVGGKDAFRSDYERVHVEVLRRRTDAVTALQEFRVATAELSRLLRLDPETPLWPIEDFRFPVPLTGEPWIRQGVEELVAFALNSRPELAENQALVQAAMQRLREARYRPFMPNVLINYSAGGFGGSPNFVERNPNNGLGLTRELGPVAEIQQFGGRGDFDVGLWWRFQNFGLGNLAETRERRALYEQANVRLLKAYYLVMTQVVQSQEQLQRGQERVDITRSALFDAVGKLEGPVYRSLRLNFERIRGGEGRPLEVQDSIRGLNDLLESYTQAITDYDRARFRLLFSLGLPAPELVQAASPAPPVQPRESETGQP